MQTGINPMRKYCPIHILFMQSKKCKWRSFGNEKVDPNKLNWEYSGCPGKNVCL